MFIVKHLQPIKAFVKRIRTTISVQITTVVPILNSCVWYSCYRPLLCPCIIGMEVSLAVRHVTVMEGERLTLQCPEAPGNMDWHRKQNNKDVTLFFDHIKGRIQRQNLMRYCKKTGYHVESIITIIASCWDIPPSDLYCLTCFLNK